jgi:hypothetical protein
MDIEDKNDLFDIDRIQRKLSMSYVKQLDEFNKLLDHQLKTGVLPQNTDIERLYNDARITGIVLAVSETIAQNNTTLWQNIERYFLSKE